MKTNKIEFEIYDGTLYYFESKHNYSIEKLLYILDTFEHLIFDGVTIDTNEIEDISINEYEHISKRAVQIYPIKYGAIYYQNYQEIAYE